MKLLAGKCYDPAVAVTKATTALLAMTAFDTTNLRLASITVPSHGMLRWRIVCAVHGATTLPTVLLGVLEGSTVRGRLTPMVGGGNLIATKGYQLEATGLITGLSGTVTLDAAYAVEVVVAATGIKYGGPNDTTTNNAFGGIVFEIFDPAPAGGAGGGATAQEVWEYATRTLTANPGISAADVWAAATRSLTDKAGFSLATTPPTAAQIRAELDSNSTKLANLDTTVGSRLATAGYTAPPSASTVASQVRTELTTELGRLDAAVSTRLSSAGYTSPDNAGIADAVSAAATAASAAAAAASDAASIKLKTDLLDFNAGGKLKIDVCCINGVTVIGAGTVGNRWRGAT